MDPKSLMEEVGGVWAGHDLQNTFREEVARLLGRQNPRSFPGAQPVSFASQHIGELMKQDYFVCEKTDGIRYLMFLTDDGQGNPCHYLIDRKNEYYYIEKLLFPHHENAQRFHVETLLDGELVVDHLPDGRKEIKFLVFDLLVIDGKDLRTRPLDKRLGYFKQHILKPYQSMLHKSPERKGVFKIEDKQTEFSYALPKMFHEIIPHVKKLHGNDGLIFTCKGTSYVSGTDPHILKWKPPEENTVDFLMHVTWAKANPDPDDPDQTPYDDYDNMPQHFDLYIFYGNDTDYEKVDDLYITPEEWESFKQLDKPIQNSIVECYLEDIAPTNGATMNGDGLDGKRWRFHRFRDDKHDANHISTFESVIESIKDHVTQDDLLRVADDIRSAWKSRDASGRPEMQRRESRVL